MSVSAAPEVADEAVALDAVVGQDTQDALLDVAEEAAQVGVEPGVGQGSADYFYLDVGYIQFASSLFMRIYIFSALAGVCAGGCRGPAGRVWYLYLACISQYFPVPRVFSGIGAWSIYSDLWLLVFISRLSVVRLGLWYCSRMGEWECSGNGNEGCWDVMGVV